MEAIFPITALSRDPAPVKDAAKKDLVRITERGAGAYIFCSEEIFEGRLSKAREDALLERDMAEAIEEGLADYEDGRVHVGTAALKAALEKQGPTHA